MVGRTVPVLVSPADCPQLCTCRFASKKPSLQRSKQQHARRVCSSGSSSSNKLRRIPAVTAAHSSVHGMLCAVLSATNHRLEPCCKYAPESAARCTSAQLYAWCPAMGFLSVQYAMCAAAGRGEDLHRVETCRLLTHSCLLISVRHMYCSGTLYYCANC